MHVIAAKAICFLQAMQDEFVEYQKQIIANAQAFAAALQARNYAIVTGGTDTHLFIVDLRNKKITGLEAEQALQASGIIVSRSCVPNDPQKPWITSGIRIGTPAITTRGMGTNEINSIADSIDEVLMNMRNESVHARIRRSMQELARAFPVTGAGSME